MPGSRAARSFTTGRPPTKAEPSPAQELSVREQRSAHVDPSVDRGDVGLTRPDPRLRPRVERDDPPGGHVGTAEPGRKAVGEPPSPVPDVPVLEHQVEVRVRPLEVDRTVAWDGRVWQPDDLARTGTEVPARACRLSPVPHGAVVADAGSGALGRGDRDDPVQHRPGPVRRSVDPHPLWGVVRLDRVGPVTGRESFHPDHPLVVEGVGVLEGSGHLTARRGPVAPRGRVPGWPHRR